MRIALPAMGMMLLAVSFAQEAEVNRIDADPWIGKSRAEVVELLGKPDKAKRSGQDGEKLTYKFLRLDPSAPRRLDVQLMSVPGVGIVAKATKAGAGTDPTMTVGPTVIDERGRAREGGVSMTESVTSSYDPKTGKLERSEGGASKVAGKVKLFLTLDPQGRVAEWSVSGKK